MRTILLTTAAAIALAACTPPPLCGVLPEQAAAEAQGLVLNRDAIPYDKVTPPAADAPSCPLPPVTPPPALPPSEPPVEPPCADCPPPPPPPEPPIDEPRIKGNNGWGNGDQPAPTDSSRVNNRAENSDKTHRNHGAGRQD